MVSDCCFSFFKFSSGYVTTSRPLLHICGLVVPYLWVTFSWLSVRIPLGYQFDTTLLPLNYYLVLSPYPFTYLSLASTAYSLHVSPSRFLFSLPKKRLNTSIDTSKKNNHIKTHPATKWEWRGECDSVTCIEINWEYLFIALFYFLTLDGINVLFVLY